MKNLFAILLSITSLIAHSQEANVPVCFQLQGKVIDQITQQTLSAVKFTAQTPSGQLSLGSSSASGQFLLRLPCDTKMLTVKLTNYRPQIISIRPSTVASPKPIALIIPLVAVDKQNTDTPYLQTEQTDYVQSDNETRGLAGSRPDPVQHAKFLITDAVQRKPLSATVCFFFTKSSGKQCLTTNAAGWFPIDFNQKDVVALEVSAIGYQAYYGNLLIEQLDGRSLKHEIRLQREATMLTVDAPEAVHCELRYRNQTTKLAPVKEVKNQYTVYGLAPEFVELVVNYQTREVRQPVRLHTGLNFMSVSPPSTDETGKLPNAAVTSFQTKEIEGNKLPTLFLPDSIPMIYFEQGSYHLRSDSQSVLGQVASYLKTHPAYSLTITGHTDNVGNPEINQTLSLYRARATASFLIRLGIENTRLQTDGIGSSQPIAPNTTEANKMLNRRVSLKLFPVQ